MTFSWLHRMFASSELDGNKLLNERRRKAQLCTFNRKKNAFFCSWNRRKRCWHQTNKKITWRQLQNSYSFIHSGIHNVIMLSFVRMPKTQFPSLTVYAVFFSRHIVRSFYRQEQWTLAKHNEQEVDDSAVESKKPKKKKKNFHRLYDYSAVPTREIRELDFCFFHFTFQHFRHAGNDAKKFFNDFFFALSNFSHSLGLSGNGLHIFFLSVLPFLAYNITNDNLPKNCFFFFKSWQWREIIWNENT